MSVPVAVIEAAMAANATTPDPGFEHLQTPSAADALRNQEIEAARLATQERARREVDGDCMAGTERCDGCNVVSPRARSRFVPGVGHTCPDCEELAASPYRPPRWGTIPA
jgi:hypothetical protein